MRLPELPRLHAPRAPEIETLAVLVELQQPRVGAIDYPHVAVFAEEDVVWLAQVWPDVERFACLIEDLDAPIRAIGDVDASVLADGNAVDAAQLAGPVAAAAERRHELAAL